MYDFAKFHQGVDKLIKHLQTELAAIRTGGANPSLLDNVRAEAYGTQMKIAELATISVADPTLLIISPWDESLLAAIEHAINQAGINLHPVVDGKIIRLNVPPLTGENRAQLVKILSEKIEEGKVMLRTLRSEIKKEIVGQKGSTNISEDDIKANLENLETQVKKANENIEQMEADKKAALLKI